MKPYERLLKYAVVSTPSDPDIKKCPSTDCQYDLAYLLLDEMRELGISDAKVTEHCFVYGTLPATKECEDKPKLGFIAHLDTVSSYCDSIVKPMLHPGYDGQDVKLGNSGRILKTAVFPHLKQLQGQTLITSDGTTILGADDKAGIAEILTMIERIQEENIPHGTICIAFTPDEEMYNEVNYFSIEEFGADYAFTIDGETEGEIQYETFNIGQADFEIRGNSIHPGSAKNIMVNASLVAMEINSMLPENETPRETEGYEGYYHLRQMVGTVEKAQLCYSIHEHDRNAYIEKLDYLRYIEKTMNEKWGKGTVSLVITEYLRNMAEVIQNHMHLVNNAILSCKNAGFEPNVVPLRGATDGVRLSFQGLPCPNLGTGGHAFHGPYEHITIESMEKVTEMLVELVKMYSS